VRTCDSDRVDEPDVEIGARAHARTLRARTKPQTHVELHGEVSEPGRGQEAVETASGSERGNLPAEVEPGVTYRDAEVRWRATVRLRAASTGRERRDA
jgi:hypothetical protein